MKENFEFEVNGLKIQAAFDTRDRDRILLPLLGRLTALQREKGRRIVVFLAAPPAAGKSTLCCYLEHLSRSQANLVPVQTVGIDGFHYTQDYLGSHSLARGGENIPLNKIKGAPETYDVAHLRHLLAHVGEDGQRWPLYDRKIHDPVEGAVEIREDILILEGNWLLLDEAPWNALECDYSIFLRAGDESQLERIVRRKMMGGYDEESARRMVRENDWPNIQCCMNHSRRGDLNLGIAKDGTMEEIDI